MREVVDGFRDGLEIAKACDAAGIDPRELLPRSTISPDGHVAAAREELAECRRVSAATALRLLGIIDDQQAEIAELRAALTEFATPENYVTGGKFPTKPEAHAFAVRVLE